MAAVFFAFGMVLGLVANGYLLNGVLYLVAGFGLETLVFFNFLILFYTWYSTRWWFLIFGEGSILLPEFITNFPNRIPGIVKIA